MADASARLGGPDTQCDCKGTAKKYCPTDPSRLQGKLGQSKECHECQNPGRIDHGGGCISAVSVLSEGGFSGIIQAWLYRAIHKGVIGTPTRLHNGGHHGSAENHGEKPRGEGPTAMKEDPDQNRQASDGQPDDRDMIDGQVKVGRGEELSHESTGGLGPRLPECGVEAGPEMDDPSQQEDPEDPREEKEEDGRHETPLKQLSQSWDEETGQRGDHIPRTTLSRCGAVVHGEALTCEPISVQPPMIRIDQKRPARWSMGSVCQDHFSVASL